MTPSIRQSNSWSTEQLLKVLHVIGVDNFLAEGTELTKRNRAVDFRVLPGSITMRLQLEQPKAMAVALDMPVIKPEVWDKIVEIMSGSSRFLAELLAGEISQEFAEVFLQADTKLFPEQSSDIQLRGANILNNKANKYVAALYCLISTHFDNDPFLLLLFRGCNREQLILQIKEARKKLLVERGIKVQPTTEANSKFKQQFALNLKADSYWTMDAAANELHYSIRADELPAARFRRFEPLPLGGLETELELHFEEMYARVARRAQAFGLGL